MTTSVRDLLYPSEEGAARTQLGTQSGPLFANLPAVLSRDRVTTAVLAVLDFPMSDLILKAWEAFEKVRDARVQTRGKPRARVLVLVGGHTLSSTQHPKIECDLNGTRIFDLTLDLELSLRFEGVVVTVVAGEIAEIGPGSALGKVSLKAKGVTLVPDREVRVTLP